MSNEKKQHGKQEIFLLTIFFIGIVLSYLVVRDRSRIVLTEPIELNFTGLSVPVPTGRIWQSDKAWKFNERDNSFTLLSTMRLSGKVEGQLICHYQLATEKISVDDRLAAQVENEKAGVADKGKIQLGWTTVDWIQLEFKGSISDSFVGITDLPDGRSLMLIAIMESDPKGAWQLFTSVCEDVIFEQNDLRDRGSRFTDRLKDIGTMNLIGTETNSTNKRVYLIDTSDSSTDDNLHAGFAIDTFNDGVRYQEHGSVGGESFYHSAGKRGSNSNTIFELSPTADSFVWQSRYSGEHGRGGESMRIELSDEGSMKVVNLFTSEDNIFWPDSASIPEMLVDSAARVFVDIENEPVVIDLIFAKGWIIPTRIQMANSEDLGKWPGNNASYGVVLEYLYDQNVRKYIFFDADKNILGKIDESRQKVVWLRIDGRELLEKEQFLPWQADIKRLLGSEQEI